MLSRHYCVGVRVQSREFRDYADHSGDSEVVVMTLSHLKISLWVLGKEPERRGLKQRDQIDGFKGGREHWEWPGGGGTGRTDG